MNKFLTMIIVAAFVAVAASAQTPAWNDIKGEQLIALQTKGDPARGQAAFEPCEGCHRKDASGRTSGAYPRLSGQHGTVLIKQIADIRAGRRINPKMEPYIDDHALTPYEIADIAAYLQGLPISAENGKGPGAGVAAGKQIYDKDCATCHGPGGEGSAAQFYPMVAAQHYRYLLREMEFIRDGDRKNSNPEMVKVIKPYTNSELETVADYLAQLAPPKK
ncbi:MAG: c-type cytochrome [Rhodocyclaceae bacterium]|nr:c-type cytochrome [Rhodocyclaceae bacterium]